MEKIDLTNTQQVEPTATTNKKFPLLPLLLVVAVIIGSTSGFLLAKNQLNTNSSINSEANTTLPEDPSSIKVGAIYGSKNENNFPDKAEGVLVVGGIGGEGSHHLVRPGGPSQNVYLSSSVIDLDSVVNARVQVWGQTMSAKKAGWLMDVGRLKVLELNAPLPE